MAEELRLRLECDGGSRGNPGRAGAGSSISLAASAVKGAPEELAAEWEFISKATNNVAEYHGLVNGLRLAQEVAEARGVDIADLTVDVFMDSKLVVEQMSGRWKIKHADMKPLAAKAKELGRACAKVTYTWVPRAQNKRADELANRAMDDGESGLWMAEEAELGQESLASDKNKQRTVDRLLLVACGTTGKQQPDGLSPRARAAAEYTASRGTIDGIYPVGRSAVPAAEEYAQILGTDLPVREIAELGQKSSAKIAHGVTTALQKLPAATGPRHAVVLGHPDDLARIIGWVLGATRTAGQRIYLDDGSLSIAEIPTVTSEDAVPMLRRLNDVGHLR